MSENANINVVAPAACILFYNVHYQRLRYN